MGWIARAGRTTIAALALACSFAAAGLGFNALRTTGLPLVAPFPYQQDCAEKIDRSPMISASAARRLIGDREVLLIDARPLLDFEQAHLPGARSMPFSFVNPVDARGAEALKKHRLVIVYCDSPEDRLASLLAAQLRQAGVPQVKVLVGGIAGFDRRERARDPR